MSRDDHTQERLGAMNAIREALLTRPLYGAQPQCLDDSALATLADGTATALARAAWLPHFSSCRRCQRAVASLTRALADPEVAQTARATERRAPAWRATVLSLSAAAALLLIVVSRTEDRPDPVHRAPALTPAAAPIAAAPVGPVDRPAALFWSAVEGADRYRVTVFTGDGTLVYETETSEPTAELPDSLALAAGERYLWQVQARTDFDRWVSSDLVEFRITHRR